MYVSVGGDRRWGTLGGEMGSSGSAGQAQSSHFPQASSPDQGLCLNPVQSVEYTVYPVYKNQTPLLERRQLALRFGFLACLWGLCSLGFSTSVFSLIRSVPSAASLPWGDCCTCCNVRPSRGCLFRA